MIEYCINIEEYGVYSEEAVACMVLSTQVSDVGVTVRFSIPGASNFEVFKWRRSIGRYRYIQKKAGYFHGRPW